MPITKDIQEISDNLNNRIEKIDYYRFQEGKPRIEEFGKMAGNGARDIMRLLLCASPQVYNTVVANFKQCTDEEAQKHYFHGMSYIIGNPKTWGIEPGWDERVNEI